ncbi:MAG: hypothetical protein V4850_20765 [Myxococcota bacterium]
MFLLLLSLFACGADECEVASTNVSDDEPLGGYGYTVGEVVDTVSGARTLEVSDASGAGSDLTVTLARGDGEAVLHEATFVQRTDFGDVFSKNWDLPAPCVDEYAVPLRVTVASEGMGITLELNAVIATPGWQIETEIRELWVSGNFPTDSATLPAAPADARSGSLGMTFDGDQLRDLRLFWNLPSSSDEFVNYPALGTL